METSELPTGCPGSRFAFPGAAAGRELGGCSTWVPSQKTAAAAGPSPPSVLNRAREPASAAGGTSVSSTSSTRKGPTARHDRRRGAGNCWLFSRSQLRSKLLAPCSARILALVRPAAGERQCCQCSPLKLPWLPHCLVHACSWRGPLAGHPSISTIIHRPNTCWRGLSPAPASSRRGSKTMMSSRRVLLARTRIRSCAGAVYK